MTNVVTLMDVQFSGLPPSTRVVVLHPSVAQQHLLLPRLLPQGVYIRLTGRRLPFDQLLEQANAVLQSASVGADTHIIIDEADRAQPAALAQIVAQVLLPLLGSGRVFILGRTLPREVHMHAPLVGMTAVLPIDRDNMLADYGSLIDGEYLLEVWGLGYGRAVVNGRLIDHWDGMLPRALFFYLVDRGMTTRAQIFESFWPALSVREATNVFHVTKRKISEFLGTDLTVFQSGYYYLAPSIYLQYDVSRFNFYAQESADAEPAEAEVLLRKAITRMRGTFLINLNMPWAAARRQEIRIAYVDALLALARLVEARGDAAESLQLTARAFWQMPARAESAERVLKLCKQLDLVDEGLAFFRHHVRAVQTTPHERITDEVRQAARALDAV